MLLLLLLLLLTNYEGQDISKGNSNGLYSMIINSTGLLPLCKMFTFNPLFPFHGFISFDLTMSYQR